MNHSQIELFSKTITVSQMQHSDFKEINQWCIDEGWNIGIHDSEIYYKIDPMGHYIAKTNKSIASLSLMKHSLSFFTLGPFIVHKSYRGQGVGEALWNEAMSRMKQEHPDALIALYAVSEQVARYKKAGFVPVVGVQRWHIHPNPLNAPLSSNPCSLITSQLIPSISTYYQKQDGTNRELLFNELLLKPETKGLVFMDDNLIKGFGFIRPCVRGFRIGTLVADTPEIATQLMSELLVFAKNDPVFMDVPASNPNSIQSLSPFDAMRAPQEDTVMMIKGTGYTQYLGPMEQLYALFSLEIG
ncbi:GNAT family N-acetyltransferase [Legionella lytica]|uniref:GNAT family N-acetyltransferase n=1 Tax=Legionella lytica TaxID=96232 RepID=A0ABW8DEA6_9GAMM